MLPVAKSNLLRDQLLFEVAGLRSGDDAASWAHRILPVKNTLTSDDAGLIEQAFGLRITALESTGDSNAPTSAPTVAQPETAPPERPRRVRRTASDPSSIDKSALAIPEPRRIRDKAHIGFVSQQPCLVCGRQPSDAHHLRFAQARALSRKVSDEFTVPLCRIHHREIHRAGNEAAWWTRAGIEPFRAAFALWRQTHPLPGTRQQSNTDAITDAPAPRDDHNPDENNKTTPILGGANGSPP